MYVSAFPFSGVSYLSLGGTSRCSKNVPEPNVIEHTLCPASMKVVYKTAVVLPLGSCSVKSQSYSQGAVDPVHEPYRLATEAELHEQCATAAQVAELRLH